MEIRGMAVMEAEMKRSTGVYPVLQYLPRGGLVLEPVSLALHTYPGLEFLECIAKDCMLSISSAVRV